MEKDESNLAMRCRLQNIKMCRNFFLRHMHSLHPTLPMLHPSSPQIYTLYFDFDYSTVHGRFDSAGSRTCSHAHIIHGSDINDSCSVPSICANLLMRLFCSCWNWFSSVPTVAMTMNLMSLCVRWFFGPAFVSSCYASSGKQRSLWKPWLTLWMQTCLG
jgi:hypothetical protein